MFQVITQAKHGSTVYVESPKREAYRYAGYQKLCGHRQVDLTFQADGAVTVAVPGLETLTFAPQA
jgi:hypothetical protein